MECLTSLDQMKNPNGEKNCREEKLYENEKTDNSSTKG